MKENVISIKNLTKEYKMFRGKKDRLIETVFPCIHRHSVFKAMDNLNLEVKQGEILGILGRNGAGKSTLLKMITGVVTPTSGDIQIKGRISSLLELGTAFNSELTGYENIYQHGQVMGLTNEQIKEKEQEIINFADIGDHLYQPVKTYSSGMFARLAFACAINVDPDILIVDEVLSVGDMAFQLKCFKKFEEFKKRGKTILFVTHSLADIIENCTRVIILTEGKKIFDGKVKEGMEKYKKLITGMLDLNDPDNEGNAKMVDEKLKVATDAKNSILRQEKRMEKIEWKKKLNLNPDAIIYGNGDAEIYDFGMFNSKNELDTIINNDEEISIKLKVKFNKEVECPTFSITIKNFNGKEICGTNTNLMKVYTGKCLKDEKYICQFQQKLKLAPGKYTLSISCSKYDCNGEIVPINRNYDAFIFEVMSHRPVVGTFDIDSKIEWKRI